MKKIFVALNFDGGEATLMAAEKTKDGHICPLGTEKEKIGGEATRYGVVKITSSLRATVTAMLLKLQNRLPKNYEITGCTVGSMCRSMHSELTLRKLEFDGKHIVTDADLDKLALQDLTCSNGNVVTSYLNTYLSDGVPMKDLHGELSSKIGRCDLAVVVSDKNVSNYSELFTSQVSFSGQLATSASIARAVTTQQERIEGVITMHIGDDTTGMTYITEMKPFSTVVVPFGMNALVKDLKDIGINEAQFAKLVIEPRFSIADDRKYTIDGKVISAKSVVDRLNARMREIFLLGLNRIRAEIGQDAAEADVVVTGRLVNVPSFIENMQKVLKRDVRVGSIPVGEDGLLSDDAYSDARYIPLVSLINDIEVSSCKYNEPVKPQPQPELEPQPEPQPGPRRGPKPDDTKPGKDSKDDKQKRTGLFDRFKTLFDQTEDD